MIDMYLIGGGAVLTAAAIGWVRKAALINAELRSKVDRLQRDYDAAWLAWRNAEAAMNRAKADALSALGRKGNQALRAKQAKDQEQAKINTMAAIEVMVIPDRAEVVRDVPKTAAERAARKAA